MHATNVIPRGCSLLFPGITVNSVPTLKAYPDFNPAEQGRGALGMSLVPVLVGFKQTLALEAMLLELIITLLRLKPSMRVIKPHSTRLSPSLTVPP
jgi:hypothetical protein